MPKGNQNKNQDIFSNKIFEMCRQNPNNCRFQGQESRFQYLTTHLNHSTHARFGIVREITPLLFDTVPPLNHYTGRHSEMDEIIRHIKKCHLFEQHFLNTL